MVLWVRRYNNKKRGINLNNFKEVSWQEISQIRKSSHILVSSTINKEIELEKYLPNTINTFAVVAIAPPYSKSAPSQCRLYEQGKVVKKVKLYCVNIPQPLLSIRILLIPIAHILRASSVIYSMLKLEKIFNVYIGVSYFYTFLGLVLRRIKLVHKVIYYNGDYFTVPTKIGIYTLFNRIAQLIDGFCTNKSDIVWNASPTLIEIKRQRKIITSKSPPQIVVNIGINNKKIYQKPIDQVDTSSICFIGVIGEQSGLNLLIEALIEIKKKIQNIKLNIIGSGPNEGRVKDMVQKKSLENNVIFWGFVADDIKVKEILSNCAIGVAPYVPSINSFTQYTVPGKVLEYLTSGLPVIVTKVPQIAFEINSRKAGFAIEYNKEELVIAIIKLLCDQKLLEEYRKNALRLALDYNWDVILKKAWKESIIIYNNKKGYKEINSSSS